MKYKKYMLMRDPGTKDEPVQQESTDNNGPGNSEVPATPVEEAGAVNNDVVAD